MAFLSSINIVASGMTAQQLRLDVVSENITKHALECVERCHIGGEGLSGRHGIGDLTPRYWGFIPPRRSWRRIF